MEMKKLHMGTLSYGADSMDEVAHQLAVAFGATSPTGELSLSLSHARSQPVCDMLCGAARVFGASVRFDALSLTFHALCLSYL